MHLLILYIDTAMFLWYNTKYNPVCRDLNQIGIAFFVNIVCFSSNLDTLKFLHSVQNLLKTP